jgi:hypothetical protein
VQFIERLPLKTKSSLLIYASDEDTKKTVLLGHLGPFNTLNEECILKNGNWTCTLTVKTVTRSLIMSMRASGEWQKLNLTYDPTIFTRMSNQELVERFNIFQQKQLFRRYQEKYMSQWKKEKQQKKGFNEWARVKHFQQS